MLRFRGDGDKGDLAHTFTGRRRPPKGTDGRSYTQLGTKNWPGLLLRTGTRRPRSMLRR